MTSYDQGRVKWLFISNIVMAHPAHKEKIAQLDIMQKELTMQFQ